MLKIETAACMCLITGDKNSKNSIPQYGVCSATGQSIAGENGIRKRNEKCPIPNVTNDQCGDIVTKFVQGMIILHHLCPYLGLDHEGHKNEKGDNVYPVFVCRAIRADSAGRISRDNTVIKIDSGMPQRSDFCPRKNQTTTACTEVIKRQIERK